jgi:hypothetical protein
MVRWGDGENEGWRDGEKIKNGKKSDGRKGEKT